MQPQQLSRLYGTSDVLRSLAEFVSGKILDVGAGSGKNKHLLLPHGESYTGMDIAPGPHIDVVGDVHQLPFPDGSFHTVVSTQVLEHVRKPWVIAQEISRVLAKDGHAIITAPFYAPYHADPHDYFRYTEKGMASMFEDAGLEIVLCTKYGGWWACMAEALKQKHFDHYRKHTRMRRRIGRVVLPALLALDRWTPPGIAYCNVLCVAKKR